jgi:peptidyl-prolyl cis-trans isomerase SurA
MKYLLIISILALAAGAALPLRAQQQLVDGIMAVVNDTAITRQQVDDYAQPAIEALQNQYANDQAGYEAKLTDTLTNSLELLIERQLILHDFDVEGYHLPDSYVDQMVQDRIREQFGDRVSLMHYLENVGETFEQFREDVRDQYIEKALRDKNVQQEIVVSPYLVEQYYNTHPEEFKVEDEVKLRMIVLNKTSPEDTNAAALMGDIRKQIMGGASFADMANVYSASAQQHPGGDYDWVGRSVLRKELTDVAFSLQPGQVSNPIDTPGSCYLLLVENRRPAHVQSLSDVRDEIENTLRAQEQSRLEKQWIESLKRKTFIRIFP